ncbi:MAG: phenylalanine--tRNA ligase subunit beta [bacterium]|nr:phenylalanine--tRNA ligase subunit beta [bacterium]
MIFSYNWLQEFLKTPLPKAEKLQDDLALHVFEVEGMEKKGSDVLLDVSILPQRGDCMSHRGLAREISAIEKKELKEPETMALKAQKGSLPLLKVSLEDHALVPRYAALVLEGVALSASPQWMQQRLETLGINSINNIVDITNYVMLELGQPLHAFDFAKIQGSAMYVRGAKTGEKLTLLDDTDMQLPKGTLVIEDQNRIIDLAGIKGGKVSSIGKTTKNIVLQAAVFDRKKIYQTKKLINYRTSAADLYSYGIDPNLAMTALERAAFLLTKYGGGKIVQVIDLYQKPRKPFVVLLQKDAVETLLGAKIPQKESQDILKRLGFKVSGVKVTVPTWREDVSIVQDLVEEVGRLHGFHAIPAQFPKERIAPAQENQNHAWQELMRDTMKEAGFSETYSYSFVGEKDMALLNYAPSDTGRLVELQNPISADFKFLRMNLLDNLVKSAAFNDKPFQGKPIKLFELGKVFEQGVKEPKERSMIAAVLSPAAKSPNAFFEAKGVVDLLFSQLGIADNWYDEYEAAPERGRTGLWRKGRTAEIKIGKNKAIGFLGEVSAEVVKNLGISRTVVGFEIDAELLLEHALEEREYRPASRFPPVLRDIAVLVPLEVRVADVLNIITTAGGELVADIDVFDIFEGAELPSGKKSLAFHIVFQAEDRTLTNEEVEQFYKKIVQTLGENPEWEVR